jgi:hypothetical protein
MAGMPRSREAVESVGDSTLVRRSKAPSTSGHSPQQADGKLYICVIYISTVAIARVWHGVKCAAAAGYVVESRQNPSYLFQSHFTHATKDVSRI